MNAKQILHSLLVKCAADITGTGDPHPYTDIGTSGPPQVGIDPSIPPRNGFDYSNSYRMYPDWRPNSATTGTVVTPPPVTPKLPTVPVVGTPPTR